MAFDPASWLKGAKSTVTAGIKTVQSLPGAIQAQTMTALSSAQKAMSQAAAQLPQPPKSPSRTQTTTSSAAVARHNKEVARYQASPAHTRIPELQRRHEAAVSQYKADPELQQYEQQLATYNAQLTAHGRAVARGRGVPATAARLQLMQRGLESQRSDIESRKKKELAGIRVLEANIRMQGVPLQAEYQRLKVEEMAHRPTPAAIGAARPSVAQEGFRQFAAAHTPIIQGLQRDAGRVWSAVPTPIRDAVAFANRRKREAQAELTRAAGPAVPFEQGWTHPVYEAGREANRRYQGFVDQALPLYRRVQPLPNIPEIHSLQRGFARAPGSFLEGLTFLPPAAERGGQLLWKEPRKLPETAARFAGQMYEGMGAAYERDPYDFGGEMIGTAALSFGIGAAARPGAVAAGSTRGSGHAGGRFRAMEFGYQTKLIRKPVQKQTPFKLSEWEAERQKYARPTPSQTTRPPPARQIEPPGAGTGSGTGRQMARYGAPYLGYRSQFAPGATISNQAVEMPTRAQVSPQRTGVRPQNRINPRVSSQDLAQVQEQESRQDAILALAQVPVSPLLDQPLDLIQTTRQINPSELVTSAPPPRRQHPRGVPLFTAPPQSPKAKKEKKKKGDDERRRRRKKGELNHWEFGPAPGLREMSMLTFGPLSMGVGGAPRTQGSRGTGSILSFGPPSVGVSARGAGPKTSSPKKVAHAAKTAVKPQKRGKSSGRTKNAKH